MLSKKKSLQCWPSTCPRWAAPAPLSSPSPLSQGRRWAELTSAHTHSTQLFFSVGWRLDTAIGGNELPLLDVLHTYLYTYLVPLYRYIDHGWYSPTLLLVQHYCWCTFYQLMATVVAYCHTLNSTRTNQLIADHLQFLTVPGKQNKSNWTSRLCLTSNTWVEACGEWIALSSAERVSNTYNSMYKRFRSIIHET
jgi:hypothetical protein